MVEQQVVHGVLPHLEAPTACRAAGFSGWKLGVLNGPFKCLKAHVSREAMGMINLFFLHILVGFFEVFF